MCFRVIELATMFALLLVEGELVMSCACLGASREVGHEGFFGTLPGVECLHGLLGCFLVLDGR